MNNSSLTPQQEELKKRLEKIRNERNAKAGTSPGQNTQSQQPKRVETRPRRNEKAPQQQRRQERTSSTPAASSLSQSKMEAQEKRDRELLKRTQQKKQVVSQKPKTKKKNSLIKQLTDSDLLADAIILSEVLSKPIALRKR